MKNINLKCNCAASSGSTTVRCCNDCGLPLVNETWDIEIPTMRIIIEEQKRLFDDFCEHENIEDDAKKNIIGIINRLIGLEKLKR